MLVKKFFRWFIRISLTLALLGGITLGILWAIITPKLPDVAGLRDIQLEVPLRVYSADKKLIGIFGERRRIPVNYDDLPENLINAFVAGEDARFFEHPGIDYQGISRAAIQLIRTGEKAQGGSTITQQMTRNYYLSAEKTYLRKIKEVFLALKIESAYSKPEILNLYLNKIFLGHRAYGVGAAAEVYYGKPLGQLSLAQLAMLAALPKAPSRINPITQPERALSRRDYVLSRMYELDYISEDEYKSAKAEKDRASYHGPKVELHAPYIAEMARAVAIQKLGKKAYTGSYSLYTTINSHLQQAANKALRKGLDEYDRRHGYRGAESQVELANESGPEQWREALQNFREIGGLIPALVTHADEDLAFAYLSDGQSIALELSAVSWARPYIDHDRRGSRPKQVDEVLQVGDIIRLRRTTNTDPATTDKPEDSDSAPTADSESYWILAQIPDVEGALVSVNPDNGEIQSLVGGYDFQRSHFNRVTQSLRQPGSGFKPFVYSAALNSGFTAASLVNDAPIVVKDQLLEKTWKPQNYSQKFFGPTRVREAMIHSRNLVSIRLLREMGVGYAKEYITRFGFDKEKLPGDLAMALGTASLTPLSIARGYSVFANGGYLVDTRFIDRIENKSAQIIYVPEHSIVCPDCDTTPEVSPDTEVVKPKFTPLAISSINNEKQAIRDTQSADRIQIGASKVAAQVIDEANAWIIRSFMQAVIRSGTGRKALELKRNDLAGKTGTTNDQRDAWFSGYNSDVVTTVWVGFDDYGKLGRLEAGGKAALPIWVDYMRVALAQSEDNFPYMADGLVKIRIDKSSGKATTRQDKTTMDEYFFFNNLPEKEAPSNSQNYELEDEGIF